LAATGLALRIYRAEHGRFPATLQELVPEYLPAVPRDALAEDGRALTYLLEADPRIVYSVGTDGVDNGGQFVDRDGYSFGHKLDLPFFLEARESQDAVPSGETEEHADDNEQAQGKDDNDQEGGGQP
jgi:hypothetical protein